MHFAGKKKKVMSFFTKKCRANIREHYILKFPVLRLRGFQTKWEKGQPKKNVLLHLGN